MSVAGFEHALHKGPHCLLLYRSKAVSFHRPIQELPGPIMFEHHQRCVRGEDLPDGIDSRIICQQRVREEVSREEVSLGKLRCSAVSPNLERSCACSSVHPPSSVPP